MKYRHVTNLLQYLFLALFVVFTGHMTEAAATDNPDTDREIMEKALPPIDRNRPKVFDTASFGLGWFWGIESRFGMIEGVIRTRVGYAGGSTDSPTYENIGDHAETVQVDFDPEKLTYRQLLEVLWNSHDYTRQTDSTQYKNAIFYHNEEQRRQAVESRQALEKSTGRTVQTDIAQLKSFTLAEDYHQKYLLKNSDLKHLLDTFYARHSDLVDSTAAARLNGYAGQNGTREQLLRELQSLGVSDEGERALKKLAGD